MPTPSQVAPATGGAQAPRAPRATHFRLASPTTAVVLGGLTLILVAALVVLSLLNHDPDTDLANNMQPIGIFLAFTAAGFVVARRQPQNPIGWILIAIAMCFLLSLVGTTYSVVDYRLHHGTLPLGWVAISLGNFWVPWLVLLPLPTLLFPAGKLPSPRWRWSLWVYVIAGGYATIASLAGGVIDSLGRHVQILLNGSLNSNSQTGVRAVFGDAVVVCALIVLALWLTWIVRLVVSYRSSVGDHRQQLKWLMAGCMATVIAVVMIFLRLTPVSAPSGIGQWIVTIIFIFAIAGLPVGIGVGVLKYRLYDIDRLISRTLSYAIVTGLLIGVYVGLVTLATRVLPFSSPLAVAASTLVAVALFNPLRRRVQRLVDRRFNRARYDAEATVAAFANRVRNDVDLDLVSSEFVRVVQTSVEPAHVSLWLRATPDTRRREAEPK